MHRAHPSWTSLTGPMLPFENTMVGVTSEGVSVLDIRSLRTAVLPCLRNHPAGSPGKPPQPPLESQPALPACCGNFCQPQSRPPLAVVSAFDPLNPHRAYVLMDSGSVLSLHMAGTKAFKACSVVQTTPAVGAGAGGAVAALRNYLLVGGDGDAGDLLLDGCGVIMEAQLRVAGGPSTARPSSNVGSRKRPSIPLHRFTSAHRSLLRRWRRRAGVQRH